MKRITIQGIAGCFHETAAHGSFPGEEVEVLPCVSFDEQFARMAADAELLGVAAIENTIAGDGYIFSIHCRNRRLAALSVQPFERSVDNGI